MKCYLLMFFLVMTTSLGLTIYTRKSQAAENQCHSSAIEKSRKLEEQPTGKSSSLQPHCIESYSASPLPIAPMTTPPRLILEDEEYNLTSELKILILQAPAPDLVVVEKPNNITNFNTSIKTCGFLGFCNEFAYEACHNTTILSCEKCSLVGAGIFMLYVVCLGSAIVVSNALVILIGIRRCRKEAFAKNELCKISLAFADLLTGFQLLIWTSYNFSQTMNRTSFEIFESVVEARGSYQALAGGLYYMLGYTSSLYHLLYIGLLRLYAIARPLKYKFQSRRSVYTGLIIVWLLAIISASVPTWFPKQFTYGYIIPTLTFLPTKKEIGTGHYTEIILIVSAFWFLPYLLMTVVTIITGIKIRLNFVNSNNNLNKGRPRNITKRERRSYITVVIMQLGFSATLLPICIVMALFYGDVLNCSNFSLPYFVCFYFGMANSLVNMLVYSAREEKFRNSLRDLFACWCCCWARPDFRKGSQAETISRSTQKSAV